MVIKETDTLNTNKHISKHPKDVQLYQVCQRVCGLPNWSKWECSRDELYVFSPKQHAKSVVQYWGRNTSRPHTWRISKVREIAETNGSWRGHFEKPWHSTRTSRSWCPCRESFFGCGQGQEELGDDGVGPLVAMYPRLSYGQEHPLSGLYWWVKNKKGEKLLFICISETNREYNRDKFKTLYTRANLIECA